MKNSRSVKWVSNLNLGILFWFLFSYSFTLSAQTNDNCANAIELNISTGCDVLVFSNENATVEDTTVAKDPSCGIFSGGDVWFTLVVPASGALRIETDNLAGATPHVMTFYSGTCGSFKEELCIQLDRQRTILRPDLAGQTLYLRMFNYAGTSSNGSSFELCVFEPEIPANDDCTSAIEIPEGETCNLESYTNRYATSEDASVAPVPSCGQYRGGDVWFKTTVPTSGSLRLEVEKSATVYTGVCGSLQEKFCKQLNNEVIFQDSTWIGQEIFIRVFNYGTEEGSDFEMCLFNPELPMNDNCNSAIEIPVASSCSPATYSNTFATSEEDVAPVPTCGNYWGGDVWFKTIVPASGRMIIESNNIGSGTEPSFTIYLGTCGAMTEISCYQLSNQYIFEDPAYGNQEVYMRMFNYDSEEGHSFNLCIYEPHCEDVFYDAGSVSICEGNNFVLGSQNLTQPGIYQETFITREGCDSIVSLTIQTVPIYRRTDSIHLCKGEGYTFPDGTIQSNITENVSYTSFLISAHDCDSIITTEIEIDMVDISVETDGTSLIALAENATFQWIDCSNGDSFIPGETNQLFTSSENGEYAVIVTQNGCSETSDCYEVLLTAIENTNSPEVTLYPNPSAGDLYIQMDKEYDFISIDIINIRGQKLLDRKYYNQSSIQMELSGLTPGTYFALIDTQKDFTITKIFKY